MVSGAEFKFYQSTQFHLNLFAEFMRCVVYGPFNKNNFIEISHSIYQVAINVPYQTDLLGLNLTLFVIQGQGPLFRNLPWNTWGASS